MVSPINIPDQISQDFRRDVYCLLGLPVDNLTMESAKALLYDKAAQKGNVVLSTINVNWVVQSFANPSFRAAILDSDIITLDGKPLLWLAKLLGYPMKEVVAGSTLIQELHQDKNIKKPLTIFLFGGDEGAAMQAQELVNRDQGGLRAVGSLNPGFGTVEEMSSDGIITAINKTQPDILLVALGAEKGLQWIEYNRNRLNAKIISHLGATINFLAGTVQRAPKLVRKFGMEWVWRILQEPKLFTRYARDGLIMMRLLIHRIFFWRKFFFWEKHFRDKEADTSVHQQEHNKEIILSFGHYVQITMDSPVREIFSRCVRSKKHLILDFRQTEFVDGAFIGLLLVLMKHQQKNGNKIAFINVHGRLAMVFRLFCIWESMYEK